MGAPPPAAAPAASVPRFHAPAPPGATWDKRSVARLTVFLALAALPALIDSGALARASALWPIALGTGALGSADPILLRVWAPLVALSGCILLLAPGLGLAAALGAATGPGRWILLALGLDLVLLSVLAEAADSLAPGGLRGAAFGALALAVSVLACGLLFARVHAGARLARPARGLGAIAPTLVVPLLLLMALAPKLHWESFNGDGVHAFESIRLLLQQPLPFWRSEAGGISGFPGVTSMLFAFPGAWFVRLFGENEGAARVPALLYLAGIHAGIAALAEERRGRLPALDAWLVWGALGVYLLVLAFSASYDPYSADLALPATQDTLMVACFLGFMLAFVRRERIWLLLFGLLTYISLPSGLMLMGLWVGAAWLHLRPRPKREALWSVAALALGVALSLALPRMLQALDLPRPGGEYESLLGRFRFVQVSDLRRLLFAAVPCGIAPLLALFVWTRLDSVARALALVTFGYFLFFYVQAYISLHHFVPAMLLPLAAFWRSDLVHSLRSRATTLTLTAALLPLAAWLSWPAHSKPLVHAREVGRHLAVRVEGYATSRPEAFASALVLRHLFPTGMDPRVPVERYGGSPYIWSHYALRGTAALAPATYVVLKADAPPPEAMERVGEELGYALYVGDRGLWEQHATVALPHPPGAALYAIDRGLLFQGGQARGSGPRIFDLGALARRLGL